MESFWLAAGVGCAGVIADGETLGVGVVEVFGVDVGLDVGVGVGLGVEVGAGEGFAGVVGVGVGVGIGVGDGVGIGVGDGVGTTGVVPPPEDGAGGAGARYVTCSGVMADEIFDAAEIPTDVTVATVNV